MVYLTTPLDPSVFSCPCQARGWIKALRSTWVHCYQHTLRGTATIDGGLADTSRLLAQNQQLTASLRTMEGKAAGADSEYWRLEGGGSW